LTRDDDGLRLRRLEATVAGKGSRICTRYVPYLNLLRPGPNPAAAGKLYISKLYISSFSRHVDLHAMRPHRQCAPICVMDRLSSPWQVAAPEQARTHPACAGILPTYSPNVSDCSMRSTLFQARCPRDPAIQPFVGPGGDGTCDWWAPVTGGRSASHSAARICRPITSILPRV
jgi:hypothetical protein